MRNLQAINNYN